MGIRQETLILEWNRNRGVKAFADGDSTTPGRYQCIVFARSATGARIAYSRLKNKVYVISDAGLKVDKSKQTGEWLNETNAIGGGFQKVSLWRKV